MADARRRETPPAQVVSRDVGDFDEFAMLFPQWDGAFHQMSRGRFQGSVRLIATPALRFFEAQVNQSLLTRGSDGGDWVTCIPITARNAATTWQGRTLTPGDLIVKGTGVPFHNRTARNTVIASFALPASRLGEAVRVLGGDRAGFDWSGWFPVHPDPRAMARLHHALVDFRRSGGDAVSQELGVRCLVDAVVASDLDLPRPSARHGHARLVDRAAAYLHDHLREPVTAMELCAELGVSDRLLRLAFKRVHGLGPLAYHRVMRMHAVRAELRAARGTDVGVTAILERWRIRRFGAFAGEYQRHFGERPSQTLGVRGWPGVQSSRGGPSS